MKDPTRILIVEDNLNDYDLARREIQKSMGKCEIKRVETEKEYLAALESLQPDIILSDYGLPNFNGMKALKLAQEHAVLTPFIMWTGSISEEAAAECMKAGANNYILKENITRLGPAILHALEERQLLLERKEAEDKLRRSELNYRALAEHSLQGIAIFQKHAIVYVNAAMCMIMGYTAEELLKMSEDQILALTHPDDLAAARERAIKHQMGKPVSALNDLRIVRKNGDIRWIQTSSNSIEYDGQPAILSTSIDITERKQAEEKLAERERRFRALIENGMDNISILAEDGSLLWENPAVQRTLGYGPGEFIGRNIFELMHPDDLPWTSDLFARVIREPRHQERGTFRLKYYDGTWRWIEATATNMLDELSLQAIVVNYRDVTERRTAEEELKESQAKYRNLVETSHDLIWSVDADGRFTYVNGAARHIYGYEPEELIGQFFFDIMDPEHHHLTPETFREAIAAANESQASETYVRHRDGRQFVLSANSIVLRDENGNVTGVTGTSRDITEQKRAEEALREERNLLRTLIDHLPDRIYAMDKQGRKTLSNIADWRASGKKTMEDVVGKTDFDVYPAELAEPFWQVDRAVLDSGQTVINFEEPGLDFEGKPASILTSKIPLRDEAGNVLGLVGIGRDITERRLAEQALRENEQRYRSLFEDMPIAIWEEDFSEVKKQLDTLKAQGVTDFRAYFTSHPEELARCADPVKILNVNNKAVEMYHANNKQELIDSTLQEDGSGEKENNIEDLIAIAEGRTSHSWEGGDETSDGIPLEIRLSWSVVPGHEEDYSKVIVTTIDITEPRRVEKAEREQRTLAEALRDTAQQLSSTLDYGEVLDHILAAVERVVPHNAATIMLIEGDFAHVVRSHGHAKMGVKDDVLGLQLPLATTDNLKQMLGNRQPVIVYDTSTYKGWKRLEITDWVRSNVGVPISIQGAVIGFILLDSKTPSFFTPLHAERLEAFANQAALAIHNARLLHQVKDELAERIRVEEELNQRTNDLAERVKELSCLYGIAELMNGPLVSQDKMLQTIVELLPSGWQHSDLACARLTLNGQMYTTAHFVETSWKQISVIIVRGMPVGMLEVFYIQEMPPSHEGPFLKEESLLLDTVARWIGDITERKQAEIELQQKNDDLRLLNTVNNAIVRGQNLDSIVDLLTVELKRIFSAVGSTLYMLSADKRSLTMQQYSFSPEIERRMEKLIGFKIPKIQIPITEGGHFHNALITKQSAITSDPKKIQEWIAEFTATRFLPSMARAAVRKLVPHIYKLLNINSTIIVPLISHEEVIGFLDVSGPSVFTRNDLKRIENIGEQLTSLIQRQQANEQLRKSEEFLQGVQNSLSAHVAILDESGTIVQVNEAWRRFGEQNGLLSADYCVGMNYIATCETATGPDADVATEMAVAIRQILAGKRVEASFEYACHSPTEKRWFTVHITCFDDGKQKWGILAHENITMRKLAEIALGERTAQFRTLFEASPDAIVLIDPTGSWPIVDCNSAAASMNGYTREELIGKSIDILNPRSEQGTPESRSAYLESIKNTGVLRYEAIHIHKNGTPIVIEVSTSLIRLGGRDMVLGIDRDITERKRAEEEIIEKQRQLTTLVSNLPGATYRCLNDSVYTMEFISDGIQQLTGYPADDFQTQRLQYSSLIHPDDQKQVWENIQMALQEARPFELIYRIITANGSEKFVWEKGQGIQRVDGPVKTLEGLITDITELKRTEQELRDSEERFRQLASNIQEVFWITDAISGEEIYISPASEKVWGRQIESLMENPNIFLDSILPEDHDHVARIIEEQRNGKNTDMEYRIVWPDGSVHWIWDRAFPIFDETGRVVRLTGIAADVTARKQAEEQLRKLSRAVEQGGSTIVITGIDGNIEYVNPKFTEVTGYTFDEVFEQNPRILKSGRTSPQDYKQLWDTIISGGEWRGELLNRKKNGDLFWEQATISPIQNENGEITHFIAVKEDITQRKQSEMEIQRHLTELEALYENGLAVGQLLEPREIGNHIIQTFARYLSWHHVAIRLLNPETDKLDLIAFNQPDLSDEARAEIESRFNRMVSNVGQGLSGLAMQTGTSIRTGNVHTQPQYVDTHQGIMSGLYMPLKVGDRIIGCISVESDLPDAFTQQDERLLATLANQASIAFENARLYQAAQLEISQRRRAQEALRTSETHYRQLADSITDILFELDQDLRYTHWNKASEMFSGIPAEDAIGKPMQDVFGSSESQLERESVYRGVLRDRQARTFETQVTAKGQKRYLEINAYPSAHGVSVVAKDITERRLAETLMQKRFELMEYAANHSLDEVMQRTIDEICELTGSPIGFFNFIEEDQKTVHLSAWSSEALKLAGNGIPMGAHFALEKAGPWTDAVQHRRSLIHNDPASIQETGAIPHDHPPLIRDMMIPIIRNERLIAIIGNANKTQNYTQHDLESAERLADYSWDIIERKEMETELAKERNQLARRVEERTADLSRANSNLARALRVKDEFLANMSHELRTPLNAILGLSESLGEQVAGPLNEKQQKYLATINESGHHLLSLINDILDLAKIEAGQISLDINKVDVNGVCQASLRMIKQLAQRKHQEISFEIDQDLGWMWADERRLKQMIVNLLSNAVKFTPDSGVLGLEVRGDREANRISISVWDRGIGISNNDVQRIFQPFVQLDSGLAREASGTGLGLALVSQMAKLHGGSVTVASQPGQGSRFTIMLPWEPALAGESNSRLRTSGKFRAIKPDEMRPTILLIEDTQEVVMMLADYLEMAGFNMVTAQDGIDGLTQAKIAHPDLILMDIQMPRMDGFETTKKLRSDPEFKETPIIALTALAMPDDRQRCLDVGMNEYLSKPVNLKALAKTIKAFLYEAETKES